MDVLLDENGIFSVTSAGGPELVYFDKCDGIQDPRLAVDGRWLHVVSHGATGSFALVRDYSDLDEALRAIAGEESFSVVLPDGQRFRRPGKVPATEVLEAIGYVIVREASVFAIVELPNDHDVEAVRLEVAQRLSGMGVNIGSADRIDPDIDDGWSVEILIPMEGFYNREAVRETILRDFAEADIVIASAVELDGVELPDPPAENVITVAFGSKSRP